MSQYQCITKIRNRQTLTLSDDDEVDVKEVVSCEFDDDDVVEAASILFARCSTLGCKTNQLQICNWLVIAPN
jgi:hypothetical protein